MLAVDPASVIPLEDLAGLRLGVVEQEVVVDRFVQLTLRRGSSAGGTASPCRTCALVGDDRTTYLPKFGSRAMLRSSRVNPIVVETAWPPEPLRSSAKGASSGSGAGVR